MKLIQRAQKRGYFVTLLFFSLSSPEQAVARVAKRVSQGGHNIPTEVILRRYHAGLQNLFQLYIPVVDYWALYDNSTVPSERLACGWKNARVNIENEAKYQAFYEHYNQIESDHE